MKTRLEPQELIKLKTALPKDLLDFAKKIKKRLRQNWDIVIGITGEEGSGKSSLAIYLGYLIDSRFDLIKNISYLPSEKEIKQKFMKLNRYQVFDVDEAVKAFHKHKWFDELQQTIIEMYATERFQNKCTLVLMPRFRDFTENFRNHRIKIWIHVLNRNTQAETATAVAYIRDPDKDVKDPWHCDKNVKLKEKRRKFRKITERSTFESLHLEKKTINYFFDFKFPPLPTKVEEVYKDLKAESRKQTEGLAKDKISTKLRKWKHCLVRALRYIKKINPSFTQEELAGIAKLNQATVSRMMKEKVK